MISSLRVAETYSLPLMAVLTRCPFLRQDVLRMVRSAEDRGFQHLFTPPSKTGRSRVLGRSRFGVVEDVLEDLFADAAFRASDHDHFFLRLLGYT